MRLSKELEEILARVPPKGTRGKPANEISREKTAPAVDRTIVALRRLSDLGLVNQPRSLFSIQFSRGYTRSEAGDALIQQLDWEAA